MWSGFLEMALIIYLAGKADFPCFALQINVCVRCGEKVKRRRRRRRGKIKQLINIDR